MVVVPGVEGEMGFLQGHVPLVSVLADGVARIQNEKDGETQRFALQGGYVEVTGKKVIILADRALPASEINAAEVREQLAALEARPPSSPRKPLRRRRSPADIDWCHVQLLPSKPPDRLTEATVRGRGVRQEPLKSPRKGAFSCRGQLREAPRSGDEGSPCALRFRRRLFVEN